MDKYFKNSELLQNTLLSYFYDEEPLKSVNKLFSNLNYEKYNTHIKPHGIVEIYYGKGTLYQKCNYTNGNLHGLYEEWNYDGQLRFRIHYKNEKLDGLYEEYLDNGQIYKRDNYAHGELNGLYKTMEF
jgi:hypothetical protein